MEGFDLFSHVTQWFEQSVFRLWLGKDESTVWKCLLLVLISPTLPLWSSPPPPWVTFLSGSLVFDETFCVSVPTSVRHFSFYPFDSESVEAALRSVAWHAWPSHWYVSVCLLCVSVCLGTACLCRPPGNHCSPSQVHVDFSALKCHAATPRLIPKW